MTGHFMRYGDSEVEIEAWLIIDPVRSTRERFTDPREAATHWRGLQAQPTGAPLTRIHAVYEGGEHRVCPYEAVKPVYDAMLELQEAT